MIIHRMDKINFVLALLLLSLIFFVWCNKYNFMCNCISCLKIRCFSSFLPSLNVILFFVILGWILIIGAGTWLISGGLDHRVLVLGLVSGTDTFAIFYGMTTSSSLPLNPLTSIGVGILPLFTLNYESFLYILHISPC